MHNWIYELGLLGFLVLLTIDIFYGVMSNSSSGYCIILVFVVNRSSSCERESL
jgi:hypothetical protein